MLACHRESQKFGISKMLEIFFVVFFVGEMVGSALSAFQIFHKREPTADEHMEIVTLVENYSKEIQDFFSKFNLSN